MKNYSVKSPAKINIGLRVLSKRKDGYHNIETIFYPVKIYDTVNVKINESNNFSIAIRTKPDIGVKKEDNICYKAVNLFFDTYRIPKTYKIEIELNKNIPIGAGLGGGSSNAASVLEILAKHIKITSHKHILKLRKIALNLGSDVPFFIQEKTIKPAYATSRGEKLRPLPDFKINYKILIVNPGIHVSTPWAYRQLKVTGSKLQVVKNQLRKIETFKISEVEKFTNDFERVVFKKFPEIEKIKKVMAESGAVFSLMSGSGSTVYGFYKKTADSLKKMESAISLFKKKNYNIFTS